MREVFGVSKTMFDGDGRREEVSQPASQPAASRQPAASSQPAGQPASRQPASQPAGSQQPAASSQPASQPASQQPISGHKLKNELPRTPKSTSCIVVVAWRKPTPCSFLKVLMPSTNVRKRMKWYLRVDPKQKLKAMWRKHIHDK